MSFLIAIYVLHQLGACYAALGDSDKAIDYFQQSIGSVAGGYPEAENSLAMEYTKQRQYELAKAIFTRHTEQFPENSRAFGTSLRACTAKEISRQQKMRTRWRCHFAQTYRNWTFHLGKIKYEQRQFADAKKWFERTLLQVPQSAEVWRAKAFAEFHLGQQTEGRASVQQWFRLEGAKPLNRYQLAYLLLQSKQADHTQLDSLLNAASGSDNGHHEGDAKPVERWFNLVNSLQEPDASRKPQQDVLMQMPSDVARIDWTKTLSSKPNGMAFCRNNRSLLMDRRADNSRQIHGYRDYS